MSKKRQYEVYWYLLVLSVIMLIEWLWIMIKLCRTTQSEFAITLLSFTFGFAIGLLIYCQAGSYSGWEVIADFLVQMLPLQTWILALKYLKSYLYIEYPIESLVYTLHKWVKWFVIIFYFVTIWSLGFCENQVYCVYLKDIKACQIQQTLDINSCEQVAQSTYFQNDYWFGIYLTKCLLSLLNVIVATVALYKIFQVVKWMRSGNDYFGLNWKVMSLHIFLIFIDAVCLIPYCITLSKQKVKASWQNDFDTSELVEYGIETALQILIGYICATMGTDMSIKKFKFLLTKQPNGEFQVQILLRDEHQSISSDNSSNRNKSQLADLTQNQSQVFIGMRSQSLRNEIECDEIVQQFISGIDSFNRTFNVEEQLPDVFMNSVLLDEDCDHKRNSKQSDNSFF